VTVYVPKAFAGSDADARRLIQAHPFATLITTARGRPHITHLPLLLDGDTALLGHMARANAHWRTFEDGRTVAVFHGPHAFVSRGWYPDPANNVPTWNFATVHASGTPELCDVRLAVEQLAARFEPPALPAIAEEKMTRLLEAVVAFRLPIARLEVKFKFSQNKTPAEIAGVIAGLRAAGDHDSLLTAEWMERQ
jgi:transcriptional regulator